MRNHILDSYKTNDKSNLLSALQRCQNEYGYLPESLIEEISLFFCIPVSTVYGLASFYNQFKLKPPGKNLVRVCRGTTCHVKKSAEIRRVLEKELEIQAGQTTVDNLFTLEIVTCIGVCSIAPVISINNEYFGRLTPNELPEILNKYKNTDVFGTSREKQLENVEY